MAYVANKEMILFEKSYAKGVEIPAKVFSKMDPARQGAFLRTKLILEVDAPPVVGEACPHCGKGPYARLAQHISLKHPDVEE